MKRYFPLDHSVSVIFYVLLVGSAYLLFAGHNQPGGGFVGGLVAGAAVAFRYVAGGIDEVRRISPVRPWTMLGAGLLVAAVTATVPIVIGHPVLDHALFEADLPVLGALEATTALPFDVGVYLVVVGVVLMVVEAFGERFEPADDQVESEAMSLVLAFGAAMLFSVGTYLVLQRKLSRIIIGVGLLGHGANVLFVIAGRSGRPAFVGSGDAGELSDPLPQAMVLTAIVITFAVTAFLLALAYRSWLLTSDDEVEDDVADRIVATGGYRDIELADAATTGDEPTEGSE